MKNIKKVMAALDLSEFSKKTLEYAVDLAGESKAELVIVHVITQRQLDAHEQHLAKEVDLYSDEFIKKLMELRGKQIQDLIQLCSGQNLNPRIIFQTGHAFEGVMDSIVSEKVDLVVMGVKGRGNVGDFLVGSIAERVFRRSPVPVLSVRD